jgi:CRISPR/Cas system-associated exonuclease Cas4 (RecB family)
MSGENKKYEIGFTIPPDGRDGKEVKKINLLEVSEMPNAKPDIRESLAGKSVTDEAKLLSALGEIGAEIEQRLDDSLLHERDRSPYPHDEWNWASEIHHPCLKNLVHARRDWREKRAPDIEALWRFLEGNEMERRIKGRLSSVGFELVESQRSFSLARERIRGKIDGLAPANRPLPAPHDKIRIVPGEIKSISPQFWDSTETIADIRQHRGWWIRGYPSQLNLYCYMAGLPGGLLILGTFGKRPRVLPMVLDYELLEDDLVRAEKVNGHMAAGMYPEPSPWDPSVCGMCGFAHLCEPLRATNFQELKSEDVPLLQYYLELKEQKKKFDDLHKTLVGTGEKPGRYHGWDAIVEGIEISTRTQMRTAFETSEEIDKRIDELKAPFATKKPVVITTIESVLDGPKPRRRK